MNQNSLSENRTKQKRSSLQSACAHSAEIDNYPSGVGPEALGAPALQEQTRDPIPPLRAAFVDMDAASTRT